MTFLNKYIKINEFIINNSHLHKDVGFYYSNFYHCRDGVKEDTVTNGLWFNNQSLNLKIGKHFTPWYAETSNNNTSDWLKKQQKTRKPHPTRATAKTVQATNEYNKKINSNKNKIYSANQNN